MENKTEKEVEVPVVKPTKKPKRVEPTTPVINNWEFKQRTYVLKSGKTPLSYAIKARGLFYFDKEKGYEREIAYTRNQNTVFVDEFKGDVRPGRIVFRNGYLSVPKEQVTLQKMLSLYHPLNGKIYVELKPKVRIENDLDIINLELDAMTMARELDIDMVEAIMRTENGSRVTQMTSKELKRDVLVFAKNNPKLFLNLMKDDNIHLRNLGIKSVEQNIITLSNDQRTFTWASTGRKLLNVPFEEHPYSALSAWFKTDEGMEVLKSVEKQLK